MSEQVHVFLQNTYCTQLTTTIVDAGDSEEGHWIAVAENIFHPQGGGQPADSGTVDGEPAAPRWSRDVRGRVELLVNAELSAGRDVALVVDAEKRRAYAALHTAGHLLDAAIRALGFTHIVSNHFPDEARIEFHADGDASDVGKLQQAAVEAVRAAIEDNAEVTTEVDGDGIRTVRIGEWATDVCGGTHVRTTSDIANFTVRSIKVKKGRLKIGYNAEHRDD